jgi:hypothetical protein
MVKAYFDSLLEEATIMAAINSGFSSNGNGNNSNDTSDDMMITNHDVKEEPLDMFDRLPLHLDASHMTRLGGGERNQQAHGRPTRESVLKRLYDALMRRSLTKVRRSCCVPCCSSSFVRMMRGDFETFGCVRRVC